RGPRPRGPRPRGPRPRRRQDDAAVEIPRMDSVMVSRCPLCPILVAGLLVVGCAELPSMRASLREPAKTDSPGGRRNFDTPASWQSSDPPRATATGVASNRAAVAIPAQQDPQVPPERPAPMPPCPPPAISSQEQAIQDTGAGATLRDLYDKA